MVLNNLPVDGRNNFDVLAAALDTRFGATHQTELNRAKLRSLVRKQEETLPELAEEIATFKAQDN